MLIILLVLGASYSARSELAAAQSDPETQDLEDRVAELESNQKKDFWDKVEASGALVGAALVAIIGGLATYLYNKRSQDLDAQQKAQDASINRIKVAGEMFPHLASSDARNKEAALVAIGILDPSMAAALSVIYEDSGGLGALERLAGSPNSDVAAPAMVSLKEAKQRLSESVALIVDADGRQISTGFIIDPGNLIVVPRYALDRGRKVGPYVSVRWPDGRSGDVMMPDQGDSGSRLALLRTASIGRGLPLGSTDDLRIRDRVETLYFSAASARDGSAAVPSTATGEVQGYSGELIRVTGLTTEAGSAGAPLVDRSGRVIGVQYQANTETDEAFAVPVEEVVHLRSEELRERDPAETD